MLRTRPFQLSTSFHGFTGTTIIFRNTFRISLLIEIYEVYFERDIFSNFQVKISKFR